MFIAASLFQNCRSPERDRTTSSAASSNCRSLGEAQNEKSKECLHEEAVLGWEMLRVLQGEACSATAPWDSVTLSSSVLRSFSDIFKTSTAEF